MLCFAFHLSGLNCFTSDIQTMLYPSMLIQSSCLVSCLVSLIILNKPPSHNSTLHPLLFPPCSPPQHPSLSQGPVPLLSQSLLQLGSFPSVSELVTPSQPPLAACCDSNVSPTPLPMMSGCPLEEVTILYLSVSLSITPTPRDAALRKKSFDKIPGNVKALLENTQLSVR